MFQFRVFDYRGDAIKFSLMVLGLILFVPLVVSAEAEVQSEVQSELESTYAGNLYDIEHQQTAIIVGSSEQNRRSVDVLVSYPSGAQSEGQDFPLIVFSHGHALDNVSYKNLTDYWVARGYVVAAPLHLDSGGDLQAVSLISKKFGRDWITASRLLDLNAVITQIDVITASMSDFKGSVSTDKVIAAGHSFGALSSQQLAGATLEQNGDSIFPIPESLSSSRVVAVVAISPPGLMKEHITEVTWQGFKAPQLVVTGPNDFFPHIWPNYEDHFVSYLTADEGDNFLLALDGMDHYLGNLIGRLERSGPPQTLAMKNLQEVSLLFIQHYLDDTESDSIESGLDDLSKIVQKEGVLKFERR